MLFIQQCYANYKGQVLMQNFTIESYGLSLLKSNTNWFVSPLNICCKPTVVCFNIWSIQLGFLLGKNRSNLHSSVLLLLEIVSDKSHVESMWSMEEIYNQVHTYSNQFGL